MARRKPRGATDAAIRSSRAWMRALAEPAAAEPNDLCDAVCRALASMSFAARCGFQESLLSVLGNAGLNVCQCLLMLGASAKTADELTAPEMAALVRYVRLTEPKAMNAVAAPIRDLVSRELEDSGSEPRERSVRLPRAILPTCQKRAAT